MPTLDALVRSGHRAIMLQVKTLNVSLTPELHALVTEHAASGRFGTASEVVRTALCVFERQEAAQAVAAPVRSRIAKP